MGLREETTTVRNAHTLDEARLFSYLADFVPGLGPDATLHQFRGGQSNPTFLIESGGRAWVMRKKPPGQLLPSAHAIEREYRVMKALADTPVPVPVMIHLCEDDTIVGTPFYIMQGMEGRVFREVTLPRIDPSERSAIYEAMGRTLADLHSVDWEAAGLSDFGKPANYLARQVARWSKQYETTRTEEIAAMEAVMPWLAVNLPEAQPVAIAHGDFRLENMIFHPTKPLPIAVLDWELATLGHPLADLAYNCLPWHLPDDYPQLGGLRGLPPDSGIPPEPNYIAAYCDQTGQAGIERWDYYIAFSLFRTAAIQQGVYARALQKSASSEDALRVGALAKVSAGLAWQAAQRDGAV